MAESVTQVSNMDVAGLCDRVTMYALELIHSQSAFNGGLFLEQDRNRTATYIDRLETFAASVSENGSLDLPKIHNVGYSLVKAFQLMLKLKQLRIKMSRTFFVVSRLFGLTFPSRSQLTSLRESIALTSKDSTQFLKVAARSLNLVVTNLTFPRM